MEEEKKPAKETKPGPADFEGPREVSESETSETETSDDQQSKLKKTDSSGPSRWQRLRGWYLTHKKLSIPLTVLTILLLLAAVPFTRYAIAAVFISQDVQVQVVDSKTGTPVSDAKVVAGSGSAGNTSGTGLTTLRGVRVGPATITVTKKYYKDGQLKATIPVIKSDKALKVPLEATGRQVKVKVTNLINQAALADVEITIADTKAKTDKSGAAIVVLPAGSKTQAAALKLKGYNDSKVTVQISDTEVKENAFKLTPTGHVYFLSNRNGTLDVMKSNLDGTDLKVVLAGTGNEDEYNTVLLASRDWKYLALLARRDDKPKVYVITTADDKLTTADEGAANFALSGWLGSSLVYSVTRTDLSPWQTGAGKLKSYNADTGKITTLDQTTGSGDATLSIYEYYGLVFLSGDTVVYAKGWANQGSAYVSDYSGKQDKIASISADGKNPKTVLAADAATTSLDYVPYSPNALHISKLVQDAGGYQYYDYVVGSQPKQVELSQDEYYEATHTYYLSPDGKKTTWTDQRDGKNAALVGDSTGSDSKVVKSTAGYSAFGWYTDSYLLLHKDGTELSITGTTGGTPVKITNYQGTTGYGVVPQQGYY